MHWSDRVGMREAAMSVLMLSCPMWDRNFSTGIHVDRTGYQMMTDTVRFVRCPYCRQNHSWRKDDALLVESFPPARPLTQLDEAS